MVRINEMSHKTYYVTLICKLLIYGRGLSQSAGAEGVARSGVSHWHDVCCVLTSALDVGGIRLLKAARTGEKNFEKFHHTEPFTNSKKT